MKIGTRQAAPPLEHKAYSSLLACCQLNPTFAQPDANMARANDLLKGYKVHSLLYCPL